MNPCVILVLSTLFSYTPDSLVRGVYINPYQGSKKGFLEYIFKLADSNYINAIVVDLKSDYGYLCYETDNAIAKKLNAFKRYIDLDYLIKRCNEMNIKLIARIVCFRDNYLAKYEDCAIRDSTGEIWYDKTGTAWVNPYNRK
ncbi:MAG: putative glycoside hydrolase, partial [candidate division WOR-3 bacterium]